MDVTCGLVEGLAGVHDPVFVKVSDSTLLAFHIQHRVECSLLQISCPQCILDVSVLVSSVRLFGPFLERMSSWSGLIVHDTRLS